MTREEYMRKLADMQTDISAYKQEPSGDLINRQDAIKAIDEKAKRIKNEDTLNGLAGAVGILFDLPSYNSIKTELSGDAVSRQAVNEIINDIRDCISVEGYCAILERLKKLPSVTQKSETVTEFADRCRECGAKYGKLLNQEPCDFAKWVASEIFDEMWEYNKDAFAEIACRKLTELGIVRAKGDEWELIEEQESEVQEC